MDVQPTGSCAILGLTADTEKPLSLESQAREGKRWTSEGVAAMHLACGLEGAGLTDSLQGGLWPEQEPLKCGDQGWAKTSVGAGAVAQHVKPLPAVASIP